MWLGIIKHKKFFAQGIPKGYEITHEFKNIERATAMPPSTIHYSKKHVRTPFYYQFSSFISISKNLSLNLTTIINQKIFLLKFSYLLISKFEINVRIGKKETKKKRIN